MNGDSFETKSRRWSLRTSFHQSSSKECCSICSQLFTLGQPKKTCKSCKNFVCLRHSRKKSRGTKTERLCDACAHPELAKKVHMDWSQDLENLKFELTTTKKENSDTKAAIIEYKNEEEELKHKIEENGFKAQNRINELANDLQSQVMMRNSMVQKLEKICFKINDQEKCIYTKKLELDSISGQKLALTMELDHIRAHIQQLTEHIQELHQKALNSVPANQIATKLCNQCQTKLFGSTDLVRRSFASSTPPDFSMDSKAPDKCNACIIA